MRMSTTGTLCSLSLVLSLAVAAPAWSQNRVGIVTTVIGPVTVARASMPAEPLKFKDDIFLLDRVTTGDNGMTRILMGGKVIVTARERSTLMITEVPGLTTIGLTSGRIAVAVDKTRMKAGERVDVRTPNAIAGVRGTVLIVETHGTTSSVTVIRGLVDVVRLDPATGRAVGPVTPVGAHQAVTVRNNVLPARPQAITSGRAEQLSQEFTPPMRPVAATAVMPIKEEVARATTLLNDLLPPPSATQSRPAATSTGSTAAGRPAGAAPSTSNTTATSTLATPTAPVVSTTTTLAAPATSLAAPAVSLVSAPPIVPTTPVVPVAAVVPVVPVVPAVPAGQSLLQPIVQPVVQTVLTPVLKLLK